ncbi:MAG TPA: UDP-phosphate galactose phosphotransferase [Hyphomonas adhaerens]|nr:UDP-phosphate galactose phosphotransferase [Hyphomonas sp.]HAE28838.1 UDP-phosphate galactose phosphotransferase [Hyphomonas adhaerens]|tara:strand:+ start:203 stop:898 length:696 start_codon:yes stop_codon:yes gene_type:complete
MGLRLSNQSRHAETAAYSSTRLDRRENDANTNAKRIMDIVIASIALVFVFPLLLVVGILIRLQDGGRAVYAQKRYGQNGRTFKCYKLRSMVANADERLQEILATNPAARAEWEETQKFVNDPRITPLGHFIRKTSIDELPQLWNILRGDMSLVGPRPIVENEIAKYGEFYRDYCAVRPGLTGLWQVEGRSNTTYEERVQLDVKYTRTRTFTGDFMIMLRTVPAVLLSRGAR